MRLIRILAFRVGLPLSLCVAPVSAQNAPASVNVDANAARHPISPNIYGFAFGSQSDLAATNFTMNRSGGNSTSTYNWQLNASNHDNDYYFESILDPPQVAGYDGDTFITQTRAANVGAQALLTIPMMNYIANLGPGGAMLWSFSIAKYGAQTGRDPYQADAGNGISSATGKPITGNNPLDANTPNSVSIQQGWIQHLISTWGLAANGGLKYYIMDNEPSLWSSTHRDIHPAPETYSELLNDYTSYAAAVRALDPNAIIVGPEEWSWWAMFLSGYDQQNGSNAGGSDYNTHNHTYYYPWLLQQLYTYQQSTGKQLINVLSTHYYPMELSNSDDDSLNGQLVRNQSTRVLWDPTYVDPSWFNQVGINGGIVNLIATLKGWVSQYYPGLQTAITEYNWGDETHLNGATTQADVLGIFGREGLDIATRWTVPANPSPTYLALEIYRNYDGHLSTFGDTSVSASVANPDYLSSFAAVRSSDGALTVMVINKQHGSTPVTISLANFGTTGTAQAYQIASATQSAITQLGSVSVVNNAMTATLPSQSITLFVIPSGNITSAPPAPTGLGATVSSGTVKLTWNAAGGATSYTVKRGTVSGGPYVSLTPVSTTTYTDMGLTNGTTYYYVVSGTNAAGPGPNSAELAVTPMVPPTFSATASATPNPVTQGSSTSVQATVTCTSNTLTNGTVQIVVLDPNGNTAATQNYTGQSFTAQQFQKYSLNLTPSIAGTYTVEVGVFSATGQQWYWNAAAAGITVNSSVVFTSSAVAPSMLAAGGVGPISVTVKETGSSGLSNANVELQIFNSSGSAVATQVWSSQNFTSGASIVYSYNWAPAGSLAPGSYSVDVGVFDSGWTHNYYWNTDATVTLTGPVSFRPPTIAKSFGASSIALGATTSLTFTLSNPNAGTALTGIGFTDAMPAGIQVASPNGLSGTCGNGSIGATSGTQSVSLSGATLTASGSCTFSINVKGVTAAMYTNTTSAVTSTNGGTGLTASATISVTTSVTLVAKLVNPNAGNGLGPQTFNALYTDTGGASDIQVVYLDFGTTLFAPNSCITGYIPGSNQVFLFNDNNGGIQTLTLGAGGSVSNGQCTLLGGSAKAISTGTNLTVPIDVQFASGFTGTQNIWGLAQSYSGPQSTWQQLGTWTTSPAGALSAISVTPNSGNGLGPQVFNAVYMDPAGASDLLVVYLDFGSSVFSTHGCIVAYVPAGNQLYLFKDDNSGVTGPITGGTAATLSNSQCSVSGSGGTAIPSGDNLTVPVGVTFFSAFSGAQTVYGMAESYSGAMSTWQTLGVWTPATAAALGAASVNPASGSGSGPQVFNAVYTDPAGSSDLQVVYLDFGTSGFATNSCIVGYIPGSNQVFLFNDNNGGIQTLTLGAGGSVSNTQCALSGGAAAATASGNSLSVPFRITFTGLAGPQSVWGFAQSYSGAQGGLQTLGTWTP